MYWITTSAKTSFGSNFGNLPAIGVKILEICLHVNSFKLSWLFNLSTEKWQLELSFGANFGNLRAFGSNWRYFLFQTFKIEKVWIDFINRFPKYSQVVKNFIRLYLRKSSCDRVEILEISIPGMHLSNKKNRNRLSSPVLDF